MSSQHDDDYTPPPRVSSIDPEPSEDAPQAPQNAPIQEGKPLLLDSPLTSDSSSPVAVIPNPDQEAGQEQESNLGPEGKFSVVRNLNSEELDQDQAKDEDLDEPDDSLFHQSTNPDESHTHPKSQIDHADDDAPPVVGDDVDLGEAESQGAQNELLSEEDASDMHPTVVEDIVATEEKEEKLPETTVEQVENNAASTEMNDAASADDEGPHVEEDYEEEIGVEETRSVADVAPTSAEIGEEESNTQDVGQVPVEIEEDIITERATPLPEQDDAEEVSITQYDEQVPAEVEEDINTGSAASPSAQDDVDEDSIPHVDEQVPAEVEEDKITERATTPPEQDDAEEVSITQDGEQVPTEVEEDVNTEGATSPSAQDGVDEDSIPHVDEQVPVEVENDIITERATTLPAEDDVEEVSITQKDEQVPAEVEENNMTGSATQVPAQGDEEAAREEEDDTSKENEEDKEEEEELEGSTDVSSATKKSGVQARVISPAEEEDRIEVAVKSRSGELQEDGVPSNEVIGDIVAKRSDSVTTTTSSSSSSSTSCSAASITAVSGTTAGGSAGAPPFVLMREDYELAGRELAAVFVWVAVCQSGLVLANSTYAASYFPQLTPFSLWMSLFIGLMTLYECFGLSFGSTLNPSVSLACYFANYRAGGPGCAHRRAMFVSLSAQLLAHLAAIYATRAALGTPATLKAFAPPMPDAHVLLGDTTYGKNGKVILFIALALEAVATFSMCLMILYVAASRPAVRGAATVLMIGALTVAFSTTTGAVMNPMQHLALALFEGNWRFHLAYLVGPVLGACAAAVAFNHMAKVKDD